MEMMGVFMFGKLAGVVAEPWNRNGKSGVNYQIGISRTYQDKWGESKTETMQVNCAEDGFSKFQKQGDMLKGQDVYLRVVPMAKTGGKNGSWLSYFAPKESDILPVSSLRHPVKG